MFYLNLETRSKRRLDKFVDYMVLNILLYELIKTLKIILKEHIDQKRKTIFYTIHFELSFL